VLQATWFVLSGMSIVFATLGLLVLVMAGLDRCFGPKPADTPRADGRGGHA